MLKAKKSIPEITRVPIRFLIITDENFSITGLSSYLITVTGRKPGKFKPVAIQRFFSKGFFQTNISLATALISDSSFHVLARIPLPEGKSITTLWVVTPVFDDVSGKVKQFTWSGCEINEARLRSGLQFHLSIDGCLTNIGISAGADRVFLFQHWTDTKGNKSLFRRKFSWSPDASENPVSGTSDQLTDFPASNIADIVYRLQNAEYVNSPVKDLTNTWLQHQLRLRMVQSILLLPVFANDEFWGFVALEQCSSKRVWTKVEINILNLLASPLSVAVEIEGKDRRIPESREQLSAFFSDSPGMFLVVDKTGKIKYAAPEVERALGFKENTNTELPRFDIIHASDIIKLENEFRHVFSDPEYHGFVNIRVRNHKNEWIWMEAETGNRYPDENIRGIILHLKHISEPALPGKLVSEVSRSVVNILDSITDGFAAIDDLSTITLWNHVAEFLTGIKKEEIVGRNLWEVFPALKNTKFFIKLNDAFLKKVTINFDYYINDFDRWMDVSIYPSIEGLFIYFKDITTRKKQVLLLKAEKNVLEFNSNPSQSIKSTVDLFLAEIENIIQEAHCSVFLVDETGKYARHLSAPRLPARFIAAMDGLPIGSMQGSFGTAMYLKKMVIAEDIEKDPLWDNYRVIALQHTLRACWAVPLLDTSEQVIGSLAYFYKKPRSPTREDILLLERTANFLRVLIENKRETEKIRISNNRYTLAARAINEAVWDWNIKTDELYLGEGFFYSFGYETSNRINTFAFWLKHIHPEDRKKVKESLAQFMKSNKPNLWMDEYRFKRSDGNYAMVVNKGYLICDKDGDLLQMVGSIEDVTEKKIFEKKLIKQELDKQKEVSQAVIEAQEKERAKIGKELHDNVNQVLSTARLLLEVALTNSHDRMKLIEKSREQIHHAITEIRNLSHTLIPPGISDLGLGESIKDLLENVALKKSLKVKYTSVGDIESCINEMQKVMLFRIIQEQVNNVLKHAEAGHLSLQLSVDEACIQLVITDDGKGFDKESLQTQKGLGLSNILSRVELFNGNINVITAPRKGCKLIVRIARTL